MTADGSHSCHLENLFFASSPEPKGSKLGRKHQSDKNELKTVQSKIQDSHLSRCLGNLFCTSSPEPKANLSGNQVSVTGPSWLSCLENLLISR